MASQQANGRRPASAVVLDRDGVINRRRIDHVKSWEEFEFLPGVLEAIAMLTAARRQVIIITNQAAVGRGLIDEVSLGGIHQRMLAQITAAGGDVARVYACPHRPEDGCDCRKPRTGLFRRAEAELGIVLRDAVVVGDAVSDIEAAQAVGCRAILIAPNDGSAPKSDLVARDLVEAVALLSSLEEGTIC